MKTVADNIDRDKLAAFCRRHHIRRLLLFGSVLTDKFREDSDVDVLVKFEKGHVPGLKFITIQNLLSSFFNGLDVDLILEEDLHARIRNHPFFQQEVIYAEG